jgi:hypothetical protein
MPVTDAMQRVTPALNDDESEIDHAQISFVTDIQERNKRLVVHHYASRSYEDYQTKLSRGAGDHTRSSHLRGMGFFDVLNAYASSICKPAVVERIFAGAFISEEKTLEWDTAWTTG